MLTLLQSALQHTCHVDPERPVLVGVSGGADSLFLLHALHRLGYSLEAAHYDHSLRPESPSDAASVENMTRQMGVQCHIGRGDVAAYAAERHLSVEAAARELRYRFLFETARQVGGQAVAVGHTASDQVETVLLHLLRGAGPGGLAGMQPRLLPNPWSTAIPLVRPLLEFWREDILAYLQENSLVHLEDSSNQDPRYTRNRIRISLLPLMREINPLVDQALWRTARLFRDEEHLLSQLGETAWQSCAPQLAPGCVGLQVDALLKQPASLRRRLLRRMAAALRPGAMDVDMASIERAMNFLDQPPASRQTDFALGLHLLLEGERLWLADWKAELPALDWPQLPDDRRIELPVPGEALIANDWRLIVSGPKPRQSLIPGFEELSDPFQACIDADLIEEVLEVRTRQIGERFAPLGLAGLTQKLSDMMINAKIPARLRGRWPVVCHAGRVIWVPGLRMADAVQVAPQTNLVVQIRCEKLAVL